MKFLLSFLSLFLVSCFNYYYIQDTPQARAANNVQLKFLSPWLEEKEFCLYLIGSNVHETIEGLTLGLFHHKIISLEKARILFVMLNEDFLFFVNNDLKDYLKNYPASIDDFNVKILITDEKEKEPPSGIISSIQIIKGKVCYSSPNPELNLGLIRIHEEPYEEAVRIVREQHPEILPIEHFLSNKTED